VESLFDSSALLGIAPDSAQAWAVVAPQLGEDLLARTR